MVAGVLSAAQWRSARELLTRDIRSVYGATETWLMTCTRLETEEDLRWYQVNAQCQVEVVDDQDRPLTPGQVGLVRMRPTRVDGYLNDPETTRAFSATASSIPATLVSCAQTGGCRCKAGSPM